MFAICEYGQYEYYGIYCIKIRPSQKRLFEQYCLDSQKIGADYGESIKVKGYTELDYSQFIEDIKKFDIYMPIECISIQEHQKKCKDTLDYIPQHGHHYLDHKIQELEKLLDYNFE